MRRTAAFALLVLVPAVAAADSAPQLVLQLGGVGAANGDMNQVSMTVDGIYAATPYGGGWLEFGVLGRTDSIDFGLSAPYGPQNTEIIEISTGIVAGPSTSQSLYPYFRAGIGAYRDQDVTYYPLLLLAQTTESSSVRVNGVEVNTRWDAGASVGVGMRFGPPRIPAAVLEARIHLTRLNGDYQNQLLVVSGGVWFR